MGTPWRTTLRQFDLRNNPLRLISFFQSIQNTSDQNRTISNPNIYASLIKACNKLFDVNGGKSVHARVIKLGLDTNVNLVNSLIHFYMSHKLLVSAACLLFDEISERTVVSVNCMVSGFLKNGEFGLGIGLFKKLLVDSVLRPNFVTFVVLISGCVEVGDFKGGRLFHCYCCKTGFDLRMEVCNTLVDLYVKSERFSEGVRLFSSMAEKDLVSWNTLMAGYARSDDNWRKVFSLFGEMRRANVGYDSVSLVNLILACAHGGDLKMGKVVHGHVIRLGMQRTSSLGSVLINIYSKCGLLEFARKVFNELPDECLAVWNSMIHGCVECGNNSEVFSLFNSMKSRRIEPDEVTMLGFLSACRNSGDLSHGIEIQSYIESSDHLNGRTILQNALIDMYAKCGSLARAQNVFEKMTNKDVVSWTSMIVGYAINGEGEEALLTFRRMCAERVEPNLVTFIGVLSACDHSGLVDIGNSLYDTMCKVYGMKPNIEHFGCMVDMLARAGMLEEAIKFVKKMPLEPNAIVYRMLANACRVHGDVDLGLNLVGSLTKENNTSSENHVISSNILAEAGRWDDVLNARLVMAARKAPKIPGKSYIVNVTD